MVLLGESAPDVSVKSRIVDIRQAMLDDLADVDASHQLTKVGARIRYAPDIQSLWYLRSDVMLLLAKRVGETAAAQRVAATTAMFSGLLPSGQQSRPTRLHN